MNKSSTSNEKMELQYLTEHELPFILQLSEKLRQFVDLVGRFGSGALNFPRPPLF